MLLYQLVADLLPFLAALYVAEAIAWARPGSAIVGGSPLGKLRYHTTGFRLVALFPWQRSYAVVELSHLPDDDGIWIPSRFDLEPGAFLEPSNFERVPWEEMGEVRREHRYLLLAKHRIALPSPAHAAFVGQRLEALRRLTGEERARAVQEETARALRLGEAKELDSRLRRQSRSLDRLSILLFVLCFGLLPAGLLVPQLALLLPWSLVLAAALVPLVAMTVVRTARRLEASGLCTDGLLLPLLLSPAALLRASVELTHHLLQGIDGAAAAVLLLDPDAALRQLRRQIHAARSARGLAESSSGEAPDDRGDSWQRVWQRRQQLLEQLAEQAGFPPGVASVVPPLPSGTAAYCPLCDGAFRDPSASCPSCLTPTLLPSETAPAAGA